MSSFNNFNRLAHVALSKRGLTGIDLVENAKTIEDVLERDVDDWLIAIGEEEIAQEEGDEGFVYGDDLTERAYNLRFAFMEFDDTTAPLLQSLLRNHLIIPEEMLNSTLSEYQSRLEPILLHYGILDNTSPPPPHIQDKIDLKLQVRLERFQTYVKTLNEDTQTFLQERREIFRQRLELSVIIWVRDFTKIYSNKTARRLSLSAGGEIYQEEFLAYLNIFYIMVRKKTPIWKAFVKDFKESTAHWKESLINLFPAFICYENTMKEFLQEDLHLDKTFDECHKEAKENSEKKLKLLDENEDQSENAKSSSERTGWIYKAFLKGMENYALEFEPKFRSRDVISKMIGNQAILYEKIMRDVVKNRILVPKELEDVSQDVVKKLCKGMKRIEGGFGIYGVSNIIDDEALSDARKQLEKILKEKFPSFSSLNESNKEASKIAAENALKSHQNLYKQKMGGLERISFYWSHSDIVKTVVKSLEEGIKGIGYRLNPREYGDKLKRSLEQEWEELQMPRFHVQQDQSLKSKSQECQDVEMQEV